MISDWVESTSTDWLLHDEKRLEFEINRKRAGLENLEKALEAIRLELSRRETDS